MVCWVAGWVAAAAVAALLAACGGATRTSSLKPPTGGDRAGQVAASAPSRGSRCRAGRTIRCSAQPPLRQNCVRLARQPAWHALAAADRLDELDVSSARTFFETYFTPFQLANTDGTLDGRDRLLRAAAARFARASRSVSVRALPLAGRLSRGRRAAGTLERAGILNGNELVWVDDPIEAFFLQVQKPGRVLLDDGSVMRVGFGGTNNQPYRSIGKWLLDRGELTPAQATMQGIKAWAKANPTRVDALLDTNRGSCSSATCRPGRCTARRRGRPDRCAGRTADAGVRSPSTVVDPARHARVPADDAPADEYADEPARVRAGYGNPRSRAACGPLVFAQDTPRDQGRRAGRLFLKPATMQAIRPGG